MMKGTRRNSIFRAAGVAGAVCLGLGVALPAAAQEDSRWLAWTGCWEPTADPAAGVVAEAADAYVVCVTPAEGGARFTTIAEGETVAERLVVADGTQRPVDQAGCRGWESARWSQDNQRVFLRSELTCDGGTVRATSGVLAVQTPEEWIDVQGVSAGDNVDVRVRRYRVASDSRMLAAGARAEVQQRELAVATARTAAAQELALSDITEAAARVEAPVLEALLVERGSAVRLDARSLIALQDAGVAGSTIDLMVAQANPDKFMIDRSAREAVELQGEPTERERARGYATYDYDPFWYGYSRYGYGYGYSRYGYGFNDPYSYYYGRGPTVIIIQPDRDGEARSTGRMVKGRGFVPNPGSTSDRARGSTPPASASSPPATTSGATGSDTKSSGAATTRKAKPRGGN